MDRVRLAYDLVQAYVYALVLAAVATVVWLVSPRIGSTPEIASLWFAVAGFGALVLITFLLTQYAREF